MGAVAAAAIATLLAVSSAATDGLGRDQVKHVLLISVEGMHQSDLDWYAANHANSEVLAAVHGRCAARIGVRRGRLSARRCTQRRR